MSWPFTDPNTVPIRPVESPRTKPTLEHFPPSPMVTPAFHANRHPDDRSSACDDDDDDVAYEHRPLPRVYQRSQHRRGESDVKAAYGGAAKSHAYPREGGQGGNAFKRPDEQPTALTSTPEELLLRLSRYAFEDVPVFIDLTIANAGQEVFTRWPGQVNYAVTLANAAQRFSAAIRRRLGESKASDRPPYPAKTLLMQVERLVMLDTHATDDQDDWDCLREALRFMLVVSEAQSCAAQSFFVHEAQQQKNAAHSDAARSPRHRALDARALLGNLIPSSAQAPTPPTPTKRSLRVLGRERAASSAESSGGHQEQRSNEQTSSQSGCSDSCKSGLGSPTSYFNKTLASQKASPTDASRHKDDAIEETESEHSGSLGQQSNALGIEEDAQQQRTTARVNHSARQRAMGAKDSDAPKASRRRGAGSDDEGHGSYGQTEHLEPPRSTSPDRTPTASNDGRSTFANEAGRDAVGDWADLTRPSMDTILRPSGRCSPAVASSDGNSPHTSFTNRRLSNGSGSDIHSAAAARPPSIADATFESDLEMIEEGDETREARKDGHRRQAGYNANKDSFLSAAEDSEIDAEDPYVARRSIHKEALPSQPAQEPEREAKSMEHRQEVKPDRKRSSQSPFIMTTSTSSESSDDEFADTEEQLDGFPEPPKKTSFGQRTLSPIITSPAPQTHIAASSSPQTTSPQALSPHTLSPQMMSNRSSRSSTGSGSMVPHRTRQTLPPRAPEPRSPLPEPPATSSNRLPQPAYRSRQRGSTGSFDSRSAQSHDSMGHTLGYSNSESSSRRDGPPSFGHDSPATTHDGSSMCGDEYSKTAALAHKQNSKAPTLHSVQAESGQPSPGQLRASNKAVGLGFPIEEREYESRLARYLTNGWPEPGTIIPAPVETFQARVSPPQSHLHTRDRLTPQSPQSAASESLHQVDAPARESSTPLEQRRSVPLQLQEVQEESETEDTAQSDAEPEAPDSLEPSERHFDQTEIKSRRAPSLRSEIERTPSVASSRRHQRSDSLSSKNSDFALRSRFNPNLTLARTGSRRSAMTASTNGSQSGRTASTHSGTSSMERREIDLAALGVGSPPIATKTKYKKGSRSRILGHTSSLQNLNKSYRIQEEGLHSAMPGGFGPARPKLAGMASQESAYAHLSGSGSKSGHKKAKEPARSISSAASGSNHDSGRSRTDSGASSHQHLLVKHPTSFLVRSESLQAHTRQNSEGTARAPKSGKRKDSLLGMMWKAPDEATETDPEEEGEAAVATSKGRKTRRKQKEGHADAASSTGHGKAFSKRGQVLDMSSSDSEEEQEGGGEDRRRGAEESATPVYPGRAERGASKLPRTASPALAAASPSRMLRFSRK